MKDPITRINPIARHVKDRGEIVYSIAPYRNGPPAAIIPQRDENSLYFAFLDVREGTKGIIKGLLAEDSTHYHPYSKISIKELIASVSHMYEYQVLVKFIKGYTPVFSELTPFSQPSRPTLSEILRYNEHVERHVEDFLYNLPKETENKIKINLLYAIHTEASIQEELLCLIKDLRFRLPGSPGHQKIVDEEMITPVSLPPEPEWITYSMGLFNIGYAGNEFAFEDEIPCHTTFIHSFALSKYPVSNFDYLQFILDKGYEREEFWEKSGWESIQKSGRKAPYYWQKEGGKWFQYTLGGMKELIFSEPVCHISYYEADAFASWAGKRLPSEEEWEVAASYETLIGNGFRRGGLHPRPIQSLSQEKRRSLSLFIGNVWEWTKSDYAPYPGHSPSLKNRYFKEGHKVLRGGSVFLDVVNFRKTRRHHAHPNDPIPLNGIRLAKWIQ